MHYKFERKVLLKENATWSDRLKQLKTSERQMLQNPFNIGWIQHFSSKNRTFRFIQPPAPTQLHDPRPSVPSPWPSGSASVYEILQQSMYPYLLFHCFSEDSCSEISSIVTLTQKFCVNFQFSFVSPALSHFLTTKSP